MNLINDAWIPIIRKDGTREKIAPWQIAEVDNPVVEVAAPRPDFQGALYQLLIGLLQTAFSPEDDEEWNRFWETPPYYLSLQNAFSAVSPAFELSSGSGRLFMQENDGFEGEALPIEDLIGGELSSNTRIKNSDLFVKSGVIKTVSPYWAALALFNVQTSGVLAWGQHRVGLRGNGPVTVLPVPNFDCSLWKKLWLSVFDRESGCLLPGDWDKKLMSDIFPWMGPTRISPKKERTTPYDCNPLQHYWPMPRRIKLLVNKEGPVRCDISGDEVSFYVSSYKRIPNGVLYSDGWQHPLSPYLLRKTKSFGPEVFLGSKASYGYRDIAPWLLGVEEEKESLMTSFSVANSIYRKDISGLRIWCFGYRAINANVYGYINKIFPAFNLNEKSRETLSEWITRIIRTVEDLIEVLTVSISGAIWGSDMDSKKRNKHSISAFKSRGEVDSLLWSETEKDFFSITYECIKFCDKERFIPPLAAKKWASIIDRVGADVFDRFVLSSSDFSINGRRLFVARSDLRKKIHGMKSYKYLQQMANAKPEVA